MKTNLDFPYSNATAKSVRLTDAGRAFLDNARALLQNAEEAVTKSARGCKRRACRTPRRLLTRRQFAEILPKILRAFQEAMPKVHVRLHDWSNKTILDGVRDGRLQLGLITRSPKTGALHDVRFEELASPTRLRGGRAAASVCPPPRHSAYRGSPPNPWLASPAKTIRITMTYCRSSFEGEKQKPRVIEEHDSMPGVMSAVEAGSGRCRCGRLLVTASETE